MKSLLQSIDSVKESSAKAEIGTRITQFERIGAGKNKDIFNELCFCILTANYNAERAIKIQKEMRNCFCTLSEKKLAKRLRELGYRYPNKRAEYILEARKYKDSLKDTIQSFSDGSEAREWLVMNIKGLGYKEASHFLRNVGCEDLAIIDFHIADLLEKHKLIEKPKTLSKVKYLEIEQLLRKLAEKSGLSLAELDLYLWCLETGKVLK